MELWDCLKYNPMFKSWTAVNQSNLSSLRTSRASLTPERTFVSLTGCQRIWLHFEWFLCLPEPEQDWRDFVTEQGPQPAENQVRGLESVGVFCRSMLASHMLIFHSSSFRHGDMLFFYPSSAGPSTENMDTAQPHTSSSFPSSSSSSTSLSRSQSAQQLREDDIDQYLSKQEGKIYRNKDPQLWVCTLLSLYLSGCIVYKVLSRPVEVVYMLCLLFVLFLNSMNYLSQYEEYYWRA